MTRIGGGGPKPGQVPDSTADLQSNKGVEQFKQAVGKEVPQTVVDSFQRAGAQLQAKLQSLTGTQLANKLNFTNEDLALLARSFAETLARNPNASRKDRSKLFAKAILQKKGLKKRGRLSQLLDDENDTYDERDRKALEDLYEMIAEQLDSSPRFAQLVDDVTESVRRIK